ncbi:hypothetical protein WKW50_23910 [Ochrobactrum sp. GPK 3]|uniref:hypothetical protein n=1 Tax=Brucella sp. 22210 TaxID=3453892 RepID=UPI0031385583
MMLERGQIVRFFYLWKRQAVAGEESGRKARPVCIVIRTPDNPARLFLFPITSQQPDQSRIALAFSQIECKRAGLAFPCWIILDEYNRVDFDHAYDFEGTRPIGAVSSAFLKEIARNIQSAAADGRLSAIQRS